ncbi:MAG: ABC transporter ATP-binding protein [Pseudomonadota bacterium]|nr:ABC transporter ATP-binding protein [Pseudomonadota bacterium]
MKFLIETNNLSRKYLLGDNIVYALREVSFALKKGELIAIMGPSGSGKSTMMNLLGCLDTPTGGSYFLNGVNVLELTQEELAETRNKKIGFVFQSFNLLARTSALENVQLPLLYSQLEKADRVDRAENKLIEVGLSDRMEHHPSQLSGGQQQRVAIARALVNEPELILADEPTGALDTKTGIEIMSIIQRLNKNGMSVIIVTHEENVARFADRIIRFRDGQIIDDEQVSKPVSASEVLSGIIDEQEI